LPIVRWPSLRASNARGCCRERGQAAKKSFALSRPDREPTTWLKKGIALTLSVEMIAEVCSTLRNNPRERARQSVGSGTHAYAAVNRALGTNNNVVHLPENATPAIDETANLNVERRPAGNQLRKIVPVLRLILAPRGLLIGDQSDRGAGRKAAGEGQFPRARTCC